MSSPLVTNAAAALNGKTLLLAETSASVTGGLIPSADSVQVGWVLRKSVTVTNAQIKALPVTPITLIAAPASGYRNKLISATFHTNTAAGAYTNINATYAACAIYNLGDFTQWAATGIIKDTAGTGATRFTTVFGGTLHSVVDVGPYTDTPTAGATGWVLPNVQAYASVNATALAVAMDNNASGALTGGNAANSMIVTVYYVVQPLT